MKLILCQLSLKDGDYKENLRRIERAVVDCLPEKADILCFPELCVTGYDFDVVRSSPLNEREALGFLAQKYSQAIFAGYMTAESGCFYDTAGFFDEKGELLCEYRKIHLYSTERDFFTPGNNIGMFTFKGWKIGMIICADLGFGELTRMMAAEGCGLILTASAWYKPWHELYVLLTGARAGENQMYVASVNRAAGNIDFCGYSSVASPSGKIVAQACGAEEQYIEAEPEKAVLKEIRSLIPWVSQMLRPEVYRHIEAELTGRD